MGIGVCEPQRLRGKSAEIRHELHFAPLGRDVVCPEGVHHDEHDVGPPRGTGRIVIGRGRHGAQHTREGQQCAPSAGATGLIRHRNYRLLQPPRLAAPRRHTSAWTRRTQPRTGGILCVCAWRVSNRPEAVRFIPAALFRARLRVRAAITRRRPCECTAPPRPRQSHPCIGSLHFVRNDGPGCAGPLGQRDSVVSDSTFGIRASLSHHVGLSSRLEYRCSPWSM